MNGIVVPIKVSGILDSLSGADSQHLLEILGLDGLETEHQTVKQVGILDVML